MKLSLIATTTMGLESVLARELKELGYQNCQTYNGKVEFEGDLTDIAKANLWCRTAGRIYLKIAEFEATTFDQLFDQTKALDWSRFISINDQFPVSKATSRKSALFSKSDCQRLVKKAVAESLKQSYGVKRLPETGALCPIRIQIENDVVVLSIDTTGEGLNKRGYRQDNDEAPLRETLAAGLILLSRWRPEQDVLLDPFCGTGTLLIEAGMIAKNIAPGLKRSFISENWAVIPKKIWKTAREDAQSKIKDDAKYRIFGSDNNPKVLNHARRHIENAGLSDIFVQTLDARDLGSRFDRGKIITNPPYGERLSEQAAVEKLYRDLGNVCTERFQDWNKYFLTSHQEFEDHFNEKARINRKLYNGGLKCWFYQYF